MDAKEKIIEEFISEMKIQLSNNDSKGNWEEFLNVKDILIEFEYHKAKLLMAMKDNDLELVKEYIADCANILMFLGNAKNLYL